MLSYDLLTLLDGNLYDSGAITLAETCIALGSFVANGTDEATPTTATGLGSGAGNVTANYGNMTLVDSSDGTSLQVCSGGDVYKVASGFTATDCSDQWLGFSSVLTSGVLPANSSILADISRRLPVIFPETIAKTNISRLRLVNSDEIPAKAEYVAFELVSGNRVAVDLSGNMYYPVQCDMVNGTAARNEVFLVSDLTTGLAILNSEEVAYSISNGFVNSCIAMSLTAAVSTTTTVSSAISSDVADAVSAVESALATASTTATIDDSQVADAVSAVEAAISTAASIASAVADAISDF